MELIDTHAHVFLPEFQRDLQEVISNSKKSGVRKIFMPNIDNSTLGSMLKVAEQFHDYCFPMIGLHPCSVNINFEDDLKLLESSIEKGIFYGIGETGTDLYWDKTSFELQEKALEFQIGLAIKYKLPIILHSRDSIDETIRIIRRNFSPDLRGIFHCFSGTYSQATEIIGMNFLLGIGGVLTFKKSDLPEIVKKIDLINIVLETDSPYLSPVPYRGKRNEPSNLVHINRRLAEIKNIDIEESASITTSNALNLFKKAQ